MAKMMVVGVKRIQGVAKESKNPFDMCRLYCLVPIDAGAGKVQVSGHGFEVGEMQLEPEAMAQFSALRFPTQVELRIEQRFVFGEFRSVVVGLEGEKAQQRPAAVA